MKRFVIFPAVLALGMLGACATYPTGPSVMVMPGKNKTLEQFQYDDTICRQFALNQTGGANPTQNSTNSAVQSAAVGTLIGAAAGALLGGNHQGAAVGAGAGLLVGSAAGVGSADTSARSIQRRIDQAYVQCMYTKGNRVPVSGQSARPAPAPEPYYYSPPPPPPRW
jgi:hypothetical protein